VELFPELVLKASSKREAPADDGGPAVKPGQAFPTAAVAKAIVYEYPRIDRKVNEAIARGVAYLKRAEDFRVGARALAGLTLLSCGVPESDPAVVKAIKAVRAGAPRLSATYELSLCILFLDRLGKPQDKELIRRIALQLLAGQGMQGGWNYNCFLLNRTQEKRLLALLRAPVKPATPGQLYSPRTPPEWQNGGLGVPADFRYLPALQYRPGQQLRFQPSPWHEDNSLTQFVILALWAAQKQGIPAERSLALVEARFRASQSADGSWAYKWNPLMPNWRVDSMTCAGLLGLAVGHGVHLPTLIEKTSASMKKAKKEAPGNAGDPAVEKALLFLSQKIGAPGLKQIAVGQLQANAELLKLQMRLAQTGVAERQALLQKFQDLAKDRQGIMSRGTILGANARGDIYFLWSMERVAMVYDLRTIGGKDWYAWGAPLLLAHQQPDGSWSDLFPGIPDTCFALLFLHRINVAQDLTRNLQKLILLRDAAGRLSDPLQGMSPGQRWELARPKGRQSGP
jgi:hypothetical protein